MPAASVPSLIAAVRRHLWRRRLAGSARAAVWACAAALLLGAAAQLLWPLHGPDRLLPLLAWPWLAALVWAGLRRPIDADCALWADRHLGGASAYTTWLDTRRAAPAAMHPPSVQLLERWSARQVPASLQRLRQSPEPLRLGRPLATLLVCGALWLAVTTLVEPAKPPTEPAVAMRRPTDAGLPPAEGAAALVDTLSQALRPRRPDPPHAERGGQAAEDPQRAGVAAEAPAASKAQPPAAGRGLQAPGPSSGLAGEAADAVAALPARTTGLGSGAGQDAGSSPDPRVGVGVSRGVGAAPGVPRSGAPGGSGAPSLRALATAPSASYEDGPQASLTGPTPTARTPAAATPPPATEGRPLTATETTYVRAWMKADAQQR